MIHRHVFHNESLLSIEKVRLSPGQAGLLCGWGIFTTVRISRGEAFAYERHWRRLEKDAALIRLPLLYTAAKVRVHLHEVIRAAAKSRNRKSISSFIPRHFPNIANLCGLGFAHTAVTPPRR